MSGDNFTEEIPKTRAVLGDLTNLPVKREFSLISDDSGLKSRDGYGKKVIFDKQVCLGVENLDREKCKTKIGVDNSIVEDKQSCESSDTDTDVDTSQENNENEETSNLLEGSVNFVKNGTMTLSVGEFGDASRDSCASTGSMPTKHLSCKKDSEDDDDDDDDDDDVDDDEGRLSNDAKQSNSTGHVCTSVVDKDLGVCKLVSSKCGAVEWSGLPKTLGSRSFELDRCTALKGDGCANLNAGADLLKACSCSFCLKAAYIWSDLHYQDIKGRIAALKKSQKEASILVNKYARGKQTGIHSEGNYSKSSKLESDLTAQWRSLFHHMEDIFAHESNQLQDGFVALKDLRENCKTDLERINEMPSDKY